MKFKQWDGFKKDGEWTKEIDVRGFIQANYTPYEGDESFLKGVSEKSKKLWDEVLELYQKERDNGGVLDADCKTPSSIDAYEPGYIDKDLDEQEKIENEILGDITWNKTEETYLEDEQVWQVSYFFEI